MTGPVGSSLICDGCALRTPLVLPLPTGALVLAGDELETFDGALGALVVPLLDVGLSLVRIVLCSCV